MDALEKNIQSQRGELDHVEQVDETQLWNTIRLQLEVAPPAKRVSLMKWWAVAASVVLLVLMVSSVLMWQQLQQNGELLQYSLSSLSPELEQQEENYKQIIQAKKQELNFDQLNPSEFQALFDELAILDDLYQEYTAQIPMYGKNDRLINTLIKYYELKIRVLEQLENELIKKKHYENYDKEIRM
ncbi:MAG: hypothetical protein AAF806_16180 [Bacteroidota bacterium]